MSTKWVNCRQITRTFIYFRFNKENTDYMITVLLLNRSLMNGIRVETRPTHI